MLKDLTRVHDRVEEILKKHPETRDNDKLLWLAYNCIHNGLQNMFSGTLRYMEFRKWLLQDEVPVFESLSRARRKIQENNEALEGAQRAKRLDEAEGVRQWAKGEIL